MNWSWWVTLMSNLLSSPPNLWNLAKNTLPPQLTKLPTIIKWRFHSFRNLFLFFFNTLHQVNYWNYSWQSDKVIGKSFFKKQFDMWRLEFAWKVSWHYFLILLACLGTKWEMLDTYHVGFVWKIFKHQLLVSFSDLY